MRQTSREAYAKLRESGVLSRQRWITYDAMFNHGPMTAAELVKKVGQQGLWKRCSELKKAGLFRETGVRRCSVSGVRAVEMDVTSRVVDDADVFKALVGPKKKVSLFVVKSPGQVGRAFVSESAARTYWENEGKTPELMEVVVRRVLQ